MTLITPEERDALRRMRQKNSWGIRCPKCGMYMRRIIDGQRGPLRCPFCGFQPEDAGTQRQAAALAEQQKFDF